MSETTQAPSDTLTADMATSLWLKTLNRAEDEPHHWNVWAKANPVCDVTFGRVDFGELRNQVPNGVISFEDFKFPIGIVSFCDAKFGCGYVNFNNVDFGDGYVDFFAAEFEQGNVIFNGAKFGEGDVRFTAARFGDGNISFNNAKFGKGKTKFNGLDSFKDDGRNGEFSFQEANFGEGMVDFSMANFGKGLVNFTRAIFGCGSISFEDTIFGMGAVSFQNTQFGDGDVNFHAAKFRNGKKEKDGVEKGHVLFNDAVFGKGNLRFEDAFFGSSGLPSKLLSNSDEEELDYMNVFFRRTSFGEGNVNFKGARFGNGQVMFEYAIFGLGTVSFESTTFGLGKIQFLNTRVAADFIFMPSKLSGTHPLHFKYCRFLERFQLTRSDRSHKWEKPISFEGSSFNSATEIRNVQFVDVPDFRSTAFSQHLSLDNIFYDADIQYLSLGPIKIHLNRCRYSENAYKLQRLKDLAKENGNHSLALKLHADELRTRRWNQTMAFPSIIDAIYDEFCEYGQSIWRPTRYLIYCTLLFALIYLSLSPKSATEIDYAGYLLFSISNSIPFLAISRNVRDSSLNNLFDGSDLSSVLYALLSAQGLIAAILLFLVGLGLRNHFRI